MVCHYSSFWLYTIFSRSDFFKVAFVFIVTFSFSFALRCPINKRSFSLWSIYFQRFLKWHKSLEFKDSPSFRPANKIRFLLGLQGLNKRERPERPGKGRAIKCNCAVICIIFYSLHNSVNFQYIIICWEHAERGSRNKNGAGTGQGKYAKQRPRKKWNKLYRRRSPASLPLLSLLLFVICFRLKKIILW